MSVIEEDVPALLAKSVVQHHGGVIDFNSMTVKMTKLGNQAEFKLRNVGQGRTHVVTEAGRFKRAPPAAQAAIARCVERGCESAAAYKTDGRALTPPRALTPSFTA